MIISTILLFPFPAYNKGKEGCAVIDYSPLWLTMERKGVSQYQLIRSGIDNKALDSLKKGRNITLLTLEKLCLILECSPNEIVRFVR